MTEISPPGFCRGSDCALPVPRPLPPRPRQTCIYPRHISPAKALSGSAANELYTRTNQKIYFAGLSLEALGRAEEGKEMNAIALVQAGREAALFHLYGALLGLCHEIAGFYRVRHQIRYAVLSLCRALWMIVTKPIESGIRFSTPSCPSVGRRVC